MREHVEEKIADIDAMLTEAMTYPLPWPVSHAAYVERWQYVHDALQELIDEDDWRATRTEQGGAGE